MRRRARRCVVGACASALAVAMCASVASQAAVQSGSGDGKVERPGRVRFITQQRAYLDRGAADGLAPRQSVGLLRGNAAFGPALLRRADAAWDDGAFVR